MDAEGHCQPATNGGNCCNIAIALIDLYVLTKSLRAMRKR